MASQTPFQMVREFHEIFSHPVHTTLQLETLRTNMKLVDFRLSLIKEEIDEFTVAVANDDMIEAADALADTLYFVFGACHVFGITDVCQIREKKFAIRKPLSEVGLMTSMELLMTYEFLRDVLHSQSDDNLTEIINSFTNIIYEAANDLHIDMNGVFAEVHRSNLTKVCTTEREAIDTVKWYLTNDTRYPTPAYKRSGSYYMVFEQSTSKVLKSISFTLPNLAPFIL
jgi:predicted HAD superfamily Cof-like phosphohydrolase